jgi:hypothetical protein
VVLSRGNVAERIRSVFFQCVADVV